jgi:hypothetical protein
LEARLDEKIREQLRDDQQKEQLAVHHAERRHESDAMGNAPAMLNLMLASREWMRTSAQTSGGSIGAWTLRLLYTNGEFPRHSSGVTGYAAANSPVTLLGSFGPGEQWMKSPHPRSGESRPTGPKD